VRDLLHVADLADLVVEQAAAMATFAGTVQNVGGGAACTTSPRELSALCADICGRRIEIARDPTTRAADIPYYVSDCRALTARSAWQPRRSVPDIVGDVHRWLINERKWLQPVLQG